MTDHVRVSKMWSSADDRYPRVNALHPRNREIDWVAVSNYADTGQPRSAAEVDIFVKIPKSLRFDCLYLLGTSVPAISSEVRETLAETIRVSEYVPIHVNGQEYWFPLTSIVNEALNESKSQFRYRPNGDFVAIEIPVWNRDVVADLGFFRLSKSAGAWSTSYFVDAFRSAGFTGIHFQEWGDVV